VWQHGGVMLRVSWVAYASLWWRCERRELAAREVAPARFPLLWSRKNLLSFLACGWTFTFARQCLRYPLDSVVALMSGGDLQPGSWRVVQIVSNRGKRTVLEAEVHKRRGRHEPLTILLGCRRWYSDKVSVKLCSALSYGRDGTTR